MAAAAAMWFLWKKCFPRSVTNAAQCLPQDLSQQPGHNIRSLLNLCFVYIGGDIYRSGVVDLVFAAETFLFTRGRRL